MNVHPILTKRPGERFEATVVRSRVLTPTTHGIELEKPAHFTFQPTQFTFLQLETPTGLEVRPMSLATSATGRTSSTAFACRTRPSSAPLPR